MLPRDSVRTIRGCSHISPSYSRRRKMPNTLLRTHTRRINSNPTRRMLFYTECEHVTVPEIWPKELQLLWCKPKDHNKKAKVKILFPVSPQPRDKQQKR